jgi:hypothetical protein
VRLDDLITLILQEGARQADPRRVNLELFEAAWPVLVGDELARRTRPVAWSEGTLHIEVSSTPWMQELSYRSDELRRRITKLFPWPLERLRLTVAERFEPLPEGLGDELITIDRSARSDTSRRRHRPLSEEQVAEAEADLAELDEEMRETLRRIRGHIREGD